MIEIYKKIYPGKSMLHVKSLPNKPLCMIESENIIYIGDARGNIITLVPPFSIPKIKFTSTAPISALQKHGEKLYYGTWDGTVGYDSFSIKLGANMIKSLLIYDEKLFASVDYKLYILSFELVIINEIILSHKIYSMDTFEGIIKIGMGSGFVSSYDCTLKAPEKSYHESSIIATKGNLTGSTDGTLRNDDFIIFQSKDWVRSIFSAELFSSGRNIIYKGSILYSHDDSITGVVKVKDCVFSIGLDYKIKSYNLNKTFDCKDEEILQLLCD